MSDRIHSFAGEISREILELLPLILNHIENPISVKNDCLRFVFANDALCARKGMPRENLLGKTLLELPLDDHTESTWQRENSVLKTGESAIVEENLPDAKDTTPCQTTRIERIAVLSGRHYIFAITYDSSRKQSGDTQASCTPSGKTHSAPPRADIHDLNNLLNVIKGYTELLLEDIEVDDPKRKDLEAILRAGDRAASLASRF